MSQKLVLCEVGEGKDVLEQPPISGIISDGYKVESMSGYSTIDNRHMCLVGLVKEVAETPAAPKAPEIFADASTFESELEVSMYSPTPGVEIHYTGDGSEPTKLSDKYTSAITLSESKVIRAIAMNDDEICSEIATKVFTKTENS